MRMTLVIVMFFCGAGSAFAQSENDYFSLTKNAGTESESIKYYPTLGDAVNAADVGDKITLLKDYTITIPLKDYTITIPPDDNTTTDARGVSINKSITLDLNDHKITRVNPNEIDEYGGALISIKDGATLTLVDNGADKGTMGSIENIDVHGGYAIVVGNGSTLIAKGVKILTDDRDTVDIDDGCTAVIDDCVIHGKLGINLRGTATITNSDISGGNSSAIQVGWIYKSDGVLIEEHKGRLTIGDGVYISGFTSPGIDYDAGTVILKALPTFGKNRPTTSSTTRAKTREGEIPYDIGMMPGLSLTFEEGTFEKPDQPMSIYIRDNDRPVDPATYTNPITTNYSKYVKDGDKVINPNDVFKWKENDFTRGFRQNTDEVIFDHAAATVTSYRGTTTPTTKPYYAYYDFSEAIAAANSGYKTASEAGGTEFIPEIKLLEDIDLGGNQYTIGENSKSWVKLDLNGKTLSGANYPIFSVNENSSLAITDNSTGDTKGSIVSNYSGISDGDFIHVNGGELTATGITILGFKLTGIYNEDGEATLTDCTVSGCYGIYSSGTVNISGGKISGCSVAGIKLLTDENNFTALPTFGTGDDKNVIDIWLANGVKMNFNEGSYTAPAQPITIKITIDSGSEPTADDLPKQFTTGYADNFKDGNTVIDPATVFAYHDASLEFVIGSNDSGEAAVFATMTFSFANGQPWMTWCDKYAWIKPSGIDVYEFTDVTATEITTTKLTADVIPTYRPLLLMKNGADGLTAMSIGPEAPSTGYDATTGIVSQTFTGATVYGATKGVDADATGATYILGRTYMLLDGEFILVDENAGFGQNRCWLTLGGAAGARRLAIVNGEATGVSGVKEMNEAGEDSWYTATGRRLERRPVRKGIYIHGGQKMIIR